MDGSIREDSLVVKSYLHRSPNRHGVPCEMFTHILVLAKILLGGSKRGGGPPPGPAHGGGKGGPPAIIGGDANEGEAPGFVGTGGGGSGFGGGIWPDYMEDTPQQDKSFLQPYNLVKPNQSSHHCPRRTSKWREWWSWWRARGNR